MWFLMPIIYLSICILTIKTFISPLTSTNTFTQKAAFSLWFQVRLPGSDSKLVSAVVLWLPSGKLSSPHCSHHRSLIIIVPRHRTVVKIKCVLCEKLLDKRLAQSKPLINVAYYSFLAFILIFCKHLH